MKRSFVLDACSIIAFLSDEEGADEVEKLLREAKEEKIRLYMNKLNLLEIYYGVYREDGEKVAEETLSAIEGLPITIIENLTDRVFREAGRLKATYSLSLADSIAFAEAKIRDARLVSLQFSSYT